MTDFVVFTLGCKVNGYEGQAMINKLNHAGFSATEKLVPAKAYIINTCSVTAEADKKSRQSVARALRLNPAAKIYVCGCSSQNDLSAFLTKQNVRLVGGTGAKGALTDQIISDFKLDCENSPKQLSSEIPKVFEDDCAADLSTHTRGFIKVQDGCNNFCSYCIIPHLRGRSRSRAIESVVAEAELAAKNTKELVISGINLSAYGRDFGLTLTDLVKSLKDVPVRKRLGSLECDVITKDFILNALDSGFCDHFHLSMQSGSDSVLKRMNRKYTAAEFIEKVELIRSIAPFSGITSDIICGFPSETDSEHQETLKTIEKIKFSDAHVFAYSERKGTPAAQMVQVDKSVRAARAAEIAELVKKHKTDFLLSQIGKVLEVYTEETESIGITAGYSSNYIKVYSAAPEKILVKLKAEKLYKDGLFGNILTT